MDIADALANPIKYQSALDKRAEQLAVLTEDMEPELNADGEEDEKGEGGDKCDAKGDSIGASVHLSAAAGTGSVSSLTAKPQRRMTSKCTLLLIIFLSVFFSHR